MKVVTYDGNQVQSQLSAKPLASGDVPAAAFGTGLNQGLQQLGGAIADMGQRINTTEAENAMVQFEREKNDILFNPEKGYFNTQGRDAFDNAQPAVKSIEDLKTKYSDSLSQGARTLFDKTAANHVTKAQVEISRHASDGFKAWEVSTLDAQVENTLENASLYWNDKDAMRVQNVIGRQAITDAASMQGLSAEAINERLQTYDSSFARAAVEAATVNSAAAGNKLLGEMDKRLEGSDKIKLQAMIQTKMTAEKTKADASYALIKSKQIANQFDDRESIMAEVDKIKDPELRDKVMSQTMHEFSMRKQAQTEARTEAYESAESHVQDGGTAESFQAENPEAWMRLSPHQQKMIKDGKASSTDWETFSDLMTMPKDQLSKVDPNDYTDKLAPAERSKLISAVRSAKGGGNQVDSQVGRTRAAQTKAAVTQLFGPTTKQNAGNYDRNARMNGFQQLIDDETRFREEQTGKKLTSDEYTNLINGLTRKVVIEGSLWNSTKMIKDIPLTGKTNGVDTDILPELTNELRRRNKPVTSDNLLNLYEQIKDQVTN